MFGGSRIRMQGVRDRKKRGGMRFRKPNRREAMEEGLKQHRGGTEFQLQRREGTEGKRVRRGSRGRLSCGMRNETSSVSGHACYAAARAPWAFSFPYGSRRDPVIVLSPFPSTITVMSSDRFIEDVMHCDRRDVRWTCCFEGQQRCCYAEREHSWEMVSEKG